MTGPAPAQGPARRIAEPDDQLLVVLATPSGSRRRVDSAALMRYGLWVVAVTTVADLRRALDRACPDVAVVDSALIGHNTASVLALVRGASTPLIAVAVDDPAARVRLLLAGVDGCLPAPYTSEELAARVVAMGRRVRGDGAPGAAHVLGVGPLQLDVAARKVRMHGCEVALTAMEFDLLECFLRHPDEALSRDRLLGEVWGYASGAAETVTVHVRRLRSKLESDPGRPELIQTIWGVGYRLCTGAHVPVLVPPLLPAAAAPAWRADP